MKESSPASVEVLSEECISECSDWVGVAPPKAQSVIPFSLLDQRVVHSLFPHRRELGE